MTKRALFSWCAAAALSLAPYQAVHAYPLDGYDETDIVRLDGYFHSLLTDDGRANLTAGALQSITELKLERPALSSFPPPQDPALAAALRGALGSASSAAVAILDLTDSKRLRYAGLRERESFVPGSVGKVMVAVALFDALARRYPHSTSDRERLLRERFIVADEFIDTDPHVVPFWDQEQRKIYFRPLVHGDRANLYSYLDWMLSASSNAAASMVMREVLLMNHFGSRYPPHASEEARFLDAAIPSSLVGPSFITPLQRLHLVGGGLFQTSFFTAVGKRRVSSLGSSATALSLVHLMFRIERGEVIDEFSSLELKRLLYLTQHRERYAGNPALDDAAVYFKAGSLYRCRPEPGYHCDKYLGNLQNQMNALIKVEDPVAEPKLRYLVALSTNVLRYNSDQLHHEIAGRIHEALRSLHAGK